MNAHSVAAIRCARRLWVAEEESVERGGKQDGTVMIQATCSAPSQRTYGLNVSDDDAEVVRKTPHVLDDTFLQVRAYGFNRQLK